MRALMTTPRPFRLLAALGLVAPACAISSGSSPDDLPRCEQPIRCDGDAEIVCVDGADVRRTCDDGDTCEEGVGCTPCELCLEACQPSCSDGVATACNENGDEITFECDAFQGMECRPEGCIGACAPGEIGRNYIGCEYWPTVTHNNVSSEYFAFAVAVTNTAELPADVVVHRGDTEVHTRTLPPGDTAVIELPWVQELKGPESLPGGTISSAKESARVADGAYRLRSNQPVVVYQFSPMEYVNHDAGAECHGGEPPTTCYAYTNDASLLLPTNALTGNYVVTGPRAHVLEGYFENGDFIAITAARDNTEVWITPSVDVYPGVGVDALPEGEERRLVLQAGEVVELVGVTRTAQRTLSGTLLRTTDNAPIQVLSGITAGFYPSRETCCGDHLEESVLPIEALGDRYIVAAPTPASAPLEHTVRVHGVFDDTTITVVGHGDYDLDAGEVLDLGTVVGDLLIEGDHAFAVTDYMHGEGDIGSGDPSQSVTTPIAQYRDDYVFYTPGTYDRSYVAIVAENGATVVLDGVEVPATSFEALPGSDHSVARVELCDASGAIPCAGNEVHRAESDRPFGIVIYGVGAYTSYLYPGGLALEPITVPPVR